MQKTILSALLICSLSGCTSTPKNTLTQISTIDALLASVYDGQMSCKEMLSHGNFGIGTFDRLDGEMIVLDGHVYQAKTSGEIIEPDLSLTTPFATVVNFEPDITAIADEGACFDALKKQIDQLAPNTNLFLAVKITGTFPMMKVRSVPAQNKPYPPLAEVTQHQTVFEYKNQTGTIVGFRCPAFVKGLNVPDYHLHFISDDKHKGGHILDVKTGTAQIELDRCNQFFMILPENSEAFQHTNLSTDRSAALQKVEQ